LQNLLLIQNDGIDATAVRDALVNSPQIPILILSTVQDEDIAKVAVQRGAQEYLLKDRLDAHLLPKAETLTGWSKQEAAGRPLEEIFRIIDGNTREAARNPMGAALLPPGP
jgi:DNA-binding NarL/FixJ family response regulator